MLIGAFGCEKEGFLKTFLESSPKGKMKGVKKQTVVLKYGIRVGKEVNNE